MTENTTFSRTTCIQDRSYSRSGEPWLLSANIKEWRISLWWLVPHVSKSHTWMPLHHWGNATREGPHVSCTWGAPLHHWGNATREGITVHVSHSPPPLRECYTWGHYRAREPHVSCTWGAPLHHWGNATREGITMHVSHMWAVREGLPSTIEGMLHVRALPCTWATRELYVRGSPPPLRECYTWGHYRAHEPPVTHVYAHSSPPPSKKSDQKTARQPHR